MALPAVTAADLRAYVRWPDAVPQEFLDRHLSGAARDVGHALGGDVPAGFAADAAEAITAQAAASAFPFLHTFTQDGGAAAVRSVQMANNRPHFLGADDQGKTIDRLKERADALISRILAAKSEAEGQSADAVDGGNLWMTSL